MEYKLKSGATVRVATGGIVYYKNEDILVELGTLTILGKFKANHNQEFTQEMLFGIHAIMNRMSMGNTQPSKDE